MRSRSNSPDEIWKFTGLIKISTWFVQNMSESQLQLLPYTNNDVPHKFCVCECCLNGQINTCYSKKKSQFINCVLRYSQNYVLWRGEYLQVFERWRFLRTPRCATFLSAGRLKTLDYWLISPIPNWRTSVFFPSKGCQGAFGQSQLEEDVQAMRLLLPRHAPALSPLSPTHLEICSIDHFSHSSHTKTLHDKQRTGLARILSQPHQVQLV